jgi:transglutaminase-like putative cysteine protease
MIAEWLNRFYKWLIAWIGGFNLLQLILLWFTLLGAGQGLTVVITGLSPGFMPTLVTVSVLMAWMLTYACLSGWRFGLTGSLLGLFGLTLTIGKIGRVLFAFLVSFLPVTQQVIREHIVDFSPVTTAWQTLSESFSGLVARIDNWFHALQSPNPLTDPMVISFLCGLAIWLVTLWAMWWVRRRGNVLPGLLPSVVFLTYFIYRVHSVKALTWLVLVGGGILLLQATDSYKQSLKRWLLLHLDRIAIEPALVFSVTILTVGMMLAGGLLPAIPMDKIRKAIDDMRHTEQGQATVTQQRPTTGIPSPAVPYSIGPGPNPSTKVVMYVSVDGYNPLPAAYASAYQQPVRYYWRSQIYDEYTGYGWTAHTTRVEEMTANQSLLPNALMTNYQLVTQHVTRLQSDEGTIFATGELLQLDQSASVLWNGSGDFIAARTDSDVYTAVSRIQSANVEQLRNAGTDYPSSVLRYLQLPDTLPARVRNLALSLTVDQPTAFDKAAILEAYLYQFPYSLNVPRPPPFSDAVDFFLFDLKSGYCDYFASAMVVMARSTGLPARMVLGYTSGIYDGTEGRFVVRSLNAHAWAEIYFPGIGWVEFDPTSNQPLPYRPGQETDNSSSVSLPPPGQRAPFRFYFQRIWSGGLLQGLLAIAVITFISLFLPLETWWLMLLPTDRALKNLFHHLYRRGRSFGILPDSSRTPNEFTLALADKLERFARDGKSVTLAAGLRSDLNRLTDLYERLLFSDDALRSDEKREAIRTWAQVRRGFRQFRGWKH